MSGPDPHIEDGDLVLRPLRGFAYQADLAAMTYKNGYLAKFDAYDPKIEAEIIVGRCRLVARHLTAGSSLLDFGCGSGAFMLAAMAAGYAVKGNEVIPGAVAQLQAQGLYSTDVEEFDAVTAWDVIEHLRRPQDVLSRCRGLLFVSLPIFEDLTRIRESKHYRPGEHIFYFSDAGFVHFLAEHGFEVLERSTHEVDAGRDSIGAFAFRRVN